MNQAIILAGGLGTRLREVISNVPKPMAPISGRPFLEYQLDYWIKQNVNKFILSVGYKHEAIIDHFGNNYKGAEIDYSIEEEQLGTGGGLLLAMNKLDNKSHFLLLNGDTFFSVNLKQLEHFCFKNDADICFSLFRSLNTSRYMGVEITSQGKITSLNNKSNDKNVLVNGGVYIIKPAFIDKINFTQGKNYSFEDDIATTALTEGHNIFGINFETKFIDIGIPDDYHRAGSILQTV